MKTMEQIADESVEIARDLRIGLYDVLGAVNGLSEINRRHIAPKIEALLQASAGMPTAFDIVNARAAAHGLKREGADMSKRILIDYTNHNGVRALREIEPYDHDTLRWGSTQYHPEPQWLLDAHDVGKKALRTFAVKDIHCWNALPDRQVEIEMSIAKQLQRSIEKNGRMAARLRQINAKWDSRSIELAIQRILNDEEVI